MRNEKLNLGDILIDKYNEEDLVEVTLADSIFKSIFVFFALLLLLFFVKTLYLALWQHDVYEKKALLNIATKNIDLAPRGIIYDAFHKPLIKNIPSFNAFAVISLLPKDKKELDFVLNKVSEILNLSYDDIYSKIQNKEYYLQDRVLLASNIDYNTFIQLESQNLQGIELDPTYKRETDAQGIFAHILGYISLVSPEDLKQNPSLYRNDVIGRDGLERYYDQYLRGVNGEKLYFKNPSLGGYLNKEAKSGYDLYTFIDKEFQTYFYNSLQKTLQNLGREVGFGLAMNPQNGAVIALFNIPSFDPSNVGKFINSPKKELFNRVVSGLYSPGSTIKPLVALGALKEGIITPEKEIFSPGYLEVPNPYNPQKPYVFLDWQYQGWVNLYSAIAKSSDVYFYEIGGGYKDQKGLGIERLKKWWQMFLLDKPTGIDLPGEKSGLLPDPYWKKQQKNDSWRLGDTYNVSIGQGDLLVTPLALLNYINAIANGGILYKPRIVSKITDQNGNVILENKAEVLKDLREEIAPYLDFVRKGMEDTVSKPYGTAYLLHDLPFAVAAKTGSAQVEGNTKINAFFVGYAPAQNPQIAILIAIENAKEGSLNVVPVAKDVLLWYYQNRLVHQK